MSRCCQCNEPSGPGKKELRPYGPGGKPICFSCMKGDLATERSAMQQFQGRLADAQGRSSVDAAMIGFEAGPVPYEPDGEEN